MEVLVLHGDTGGLLSLQRRFISVVETTGIPRLNCRTMIWFEKYDVFIAFGLRKGGFRHPSIKSWDVPLDTYCAFARCKRLVVAIRDGKPIDMPKDIICCLLPYIEVDKRILTLRSRKSIQYDVVDI